MSDKMSTDRRYRDFACIVYAYSAPERWIQIIKDLGLNALISPVHALGSTPAHWHVLVEYSKPQKCSYVYSVMRSFGGVSCRPILDPVSFSKYIGWGVWING